MENAKKFFEETLRSEQAQKLLKAMEKPSNEEETLACYAEIAAKIGIELTAEDIRAYFEQKKDYGHLDDSELAQVAGGLPTKCKHSFLDKENCWLTDACDLAFLNYRNYKCKNNEL